MVTVPEKIAFSRRLNEALDATGFAEKGAGRQVALAAKYKVSQNAVRKWLEGESIPEVSRLMQLAVDFHVSFEWLATGRGGKPVPHADPTLSALLSRYSTADEATKQLIDLALAQPDEPVPEDLPASIRLLLQSLRSAIAEHSNKKT
jgi:transcriptional regulator with XRE-family HTH domain